MEERALYRAILAAPHEDAPRLIYADWLDENADQFPPPVAVAERARAAFIRRQCERARNAPEGWRTDPHDVAPELTKPERRLLFHHGKKWRRAFSPRESSATFDRGFLRPYRALTPDHVLDLPTIDTYRPFLPLPPDSTVRRYICDEDGSFAVAPLWDLHLYAPGWQNSLNADWGQYGLLLTAAARSPALERVGWLKLSFFRTPVLDFLRTGNFANVETLVLNSGPFPEVLEAVTENESFRSLRYVRFGGDRWAWAASYPMLLRFFALDAKIRAANARHVPHGEMRTVLRGILRDTPFVPPPPPPAPTPATVLPQWPAFTAAPAPAAESPIRSLWVLGYLIVMFLLIARFSGTKSTTSPPTIPTHDLRFLDYKPLEYKFPDLKSYQFETDPLRKSRPTLDELLKRPHLYPPGTLFDSTPKVPVAPPPREVKRPVEPSPLPREK